MEKMNNIKKGSKVKHTPTGDTGVVWNVLNDQFVQVDFGKGKFINGMTLISNLELI